MNVRTSRLGKIKLPGQVNYHVYERMVVFTCRENNKIVRVLGLPIEDIICFDWEAE